MAKRSKKKEDNSKENKDTQSRTQIIITVVGAVATIIVALIGILPNILPNREVFPAPTLVIPTNKIIAPTATKVTDTPMSPTESPQSKIITATGSPIVPTSQPIVQIVIGQPAEQKEAVESAASAIIQVAKKLPLTIKDAFDSNEYSWPILQDTFNHGVECKFSIAESKYSISVVTTETSGPDGCWAIVPRNGSNFYLSFEAQLVQKRNATLMAYYRYIDDNNFYWFILNPQTQTTSFGIRQDNKDTSFFNEVYVPIINKNDANKIEILAIQDSHMLSINDHLISIVTDNTFTTGQVRLWLYLREANQFEELLIDNFELRGN